MAMTDHDENYETVELCLGCGREGCDSCPCGVYTVRRKKSRLQPEPEDSPEFAQAVVQGERPLDKDCKCCGYACRGFLCDYCFRERLMDSGHQCKTKPSSPAPETEFTPLKDRQSALIGRLLARKGTSEHQGQPHAGLQYALDECIDLEEKLLESIRTISQLRSQLRNWETWGTVEIALRNPNVDSYMKHWEGRALAAEEKVVELEGRIANALL